MSRHAWSAKVPVSLNCPGKGSDLHLFLALETQLPCVKTSE